MQFLLLFAFFIAVIGLAAGKPFLDEDNASNNWAVLIAGSNGWGNYRHQADIAHAYHILIDHGISAEQVIVIAYDDIANNPQNQNPGQIFNRPGGKDVYKGLKIDYRQADVIPDTIVNVLKGNATAMEGKGTGRVLESKETDNVFIYFSGHGEIHMLDILGDSLSQATLNETLYYMQENQMYKKLMFYLESCYSGSMFEGLSADRNIYAITASKPDEESWSHFCFSPNTTVGCFADEFSNNWMTDTEMHSIITEKIGTQFDDVQNATVESHPCQFGDLKFRDENLSDYLGKKPVNPSIDDITFFEDSTKYLKIKNRDVALLTIEHRMRVDEYPEEEIKAVMDKYYQKRDSMKAFIDKALHTLAPNQVYPKLTTNLKCHEKVFNVWVKKCAPLGSNPYALTFSGDIASLCEIFQNPDPIVAYFEKECKNGPLFVDVL